MSGSSTWPCGRIPTSEPTTATRSINGTRRFATTHHVWHLGDFSGEDVPFERAAEIFRKLNGKIHLIRGNHDGDEICSKLPWASVDIMRTIVGSDGRKVRLCHYPLLEWEGYYAGDIHFHGHTHDRRPSSRRRWDCGVDHQSFRPMTYDAIAERMNTLPDNISDGSDD